MVSALDSGSSSLDLSLGQGFFTLTVPFSTQVGEFNAEHCDGLTSHPGESRNAPSRFMKNPDKLRPLGLYGDLTFIIIFFCA